jgi:hypothetical protein
MALRFNINGLTNEILEKLEEQLNYALIAWRTEVLDGLKHPFYGMDEKPYVEYTIEKGSKKIIAYLKANTYVLADSYGTGSLMLDNNPGLAEYKRNRKMWNPARTGKRIVGRPAGNYVDVFGRRRHSKGSLAGKPIENMRFRGKRAIKDYFIAPTHPSYAIQMAEEWLYRTYLPNAYKLAIQNVNFAKYLKES